MDLGGGCIQSLNLGVPANKTVASSMAGTAAATLIGTFSATYAKSWSVFNLTGRNLEILIGADNGTTSVGIFCPGTASAVAIGMGVRSPIAMQQGYLVWARTTENTPITAASTTPLFINFWA